MLTHGQLRLTEDHDMAAQPLKTNFALHLAVRDHDLPRVRRLLAAGADPREMDMRGLRPLDALAQEIPHPDDLRIADAIITAMGPKWWYLGRNALRAAVEYDNSDLARLLIRRGYRLGYRAPLLHRAVALDRVDLLPLFTCPTNVSRFDDTGHAPLHYAQSGDAVDALMEAGANVDRRNREGQTALHLAPSADVAVRLLAHGAVVDARDCEGRTPLHLAVDRRVARVLLDQGSPVDPQDATGATPLLLHVSRRSAGARTLLRAGADPNTRDNSGRTALLLAVRTGDRKTTGDLLRAGADPRLRDNGGAGLAAHLKHVWVESTREDIYLRVIRAAPDYLLDLDDHADPALIRAIDRLEAPDGARFTHRHVAKLLTSPNAKLRRAALRIIATLNISFEPRDSRPDVA